MKYKNSFLCGCLCAALLLSACGSTAADLKEVDDTEVTEEKDESRAKTEEPAEAEAPDAAEGMEAAAPDGFEKGEVKDHTYYNGYEGIKIRVPDDWYVMSDEELSEKNNIDPESFSDATVAQMAEKMRDPMVFGAHNNDEEKPQLVMVKVQHGISAHIIKEDTDIEKAKENMLAVMRAGNYKSTDVKLYEINGEKYIVPIYGVEINGVDQYVAVIVYGTKEYTLTISMEAYERFVLEDMINNYLTEYER